MKGTTLKIYPVCKICGIKKIDIQKNGWLCADYKGKKDSSGNYRLLNNGRHKYK